MREPILKDGDYRLSGGNLQYAEGAQAVLERCCSACVQDGGGFPLQRGSAAGFGS